MDRPILNKYYSIEILVESIEGYLNYIEGDDYCEDETSNYEHNIFENALKCLYGKDVFKYINEKISEQEEK